MAHTLFPYSRNGIGSEKRKFVLTIIFASSFRTIDLLDVSNSRKKKEKEIGDEPTKLQSIAKISSSITDETVFNGAKFVEMARRIDKLVACDRTESRWL